MGTSPRPAEGTRAQRVVGAELMALTNIFWVFALFLALAQEAECLPARKYGFQGLANDLVAKIDDVADATEIEAENPSGVMQDGKLNSRRQRSGFWSDRSWMVESNKKKTTSWGVLGKHIGGKRKRYAPKTDWVSSTNNLPSGESLLALNRRSGRDRPRTRGILNPAFRSFRGAFRGKSAYQRYTDSRSSRTMAKLDKIGCVNSKTGKFDSPDAEDDNIQDLIGW